MSALSAVPQVAAAAAAGEAEGSQALSSLAQEAVSSSSAVATAVHNCLYRPYIARQVGSELHCRPLLYLMPDLAIATGWKRSSAHARGSGKAMRRCHILGKCCAVHAISQEVALAGC